MRRYIIPTMLLAGVLLAGCSQSDPVATPGPDAEADAVELQGIAPVLDGLETEAKAVTRAAADYTVNTDDDPTHTLDTRTDWLLDVVIYKGNNPYTYGQGTLTYSGSDKTWTAPAQKIYFPNYTKQPMELTLYPPTWNPDGTTDIATMQSTAALVLAQDVLIRNDATTVAVNPAHIPTVKLKHAHSMLNFILSRVDDTQVSGVEVEVDNVLYTPYRVSDDQGLEYMLIVPPASGNPTIHITTTDGAVYSQGITLPGTAGTLVNHCYCFELLGLELSLFTITVTNWATGEAIDGEYTSVTAYPTFRGPAGTTVTLIYDNGLTQEITFNDRNEATAKPLARTLVRIQPSGGNLITLPSPIALRDMVIDLTPYL